MSEIMKKEKEREREKKKRGKGFFVVFQIRPTLSERRIFVFSNQLINGAAFVNINIQKYQRKNNNNNSTHYHRFHQQQRHKQTNKH